MASVRRVGRGSRRPLVPVESRYVVDDGGRVVDPFVPDGDVRMRASRSVEFAAEEAERVEVVFGLPVGTDLVVEMGKRVSVPVLWHPDRIVPATGSYVASLNAAAR